MRTESHGGDGGPLTEHGTGHRITGGHRAERSFRPGGGGGAGISAGAPSGIRKKKNLVLSAVKCPRYSRSEVFKVRLRVCPSVGPSGGFKRRSGCSR
ncbi:hypothetical protein PBY51_001120 [Eleginops maclovinus]|uniref:Uncharacterized protein n=1 Tax=Eleginops maclovinus TaxID=56733 RepID=A0AAN7XNV0_ELEMC|nr:hypothetical protein PBY51_001120 [Eleginops maclovinus]